jgi:hypothetical protein
MVVAQSPRSAVLGPDRVGVGDDIDAFVRTRRRNPRHVIAHCPKKARDEFLEIVRFHLFQVLLDLGPRCFFCFFEGRRGVR